MLWIILFFICLTQVPLDSSATHVIHFKISTNWQHYQVHSAQQFFNYKNNQVAIPDNQLLGIKKSKLICLQCLMFNTAILLLYISMYLGMQSTAS